MTRPLLLSLYFSFSLVFPVTSHAGEQDWEPRLDEDGIIIHTRPFAGETHRQFRAIAEINASLAQVISLLQDNDACTQWLHQCEASRLLEKISNEERYFYQVSDLPFPAKSRDAIFHALVTYGDNQSVRISMVSKPDYLPETKNVRIVRAEGEYLLEPVSEDRVMITWHMFIDPAGALPAWMVNSVLTDLPYKSLKAFRDLVKQPPYNRAIFTYDDAGIPNDIVFAEN